MMTPDDKRMIANHISNAGLLTRIAFTGLEKPDIPGTMKALQDCIAECNEALLQLLRHSGGVPAR